MAVACCVLKPKQTQESGIREPYQPSLLVWLVATSILLTGCLSHIYVMPFLTYQPELVSLVY